MSQFNHLNNIPDKIMDCKKCGKKFSISISDGSMWGGHDSETIQCPWCGANNGKEYGGDMIMVFTSRLK